MSKKDNPGKKFLSNFLNRPYGSKSLFGINLPEYGFSEKFDTNVPQPAPTTTPEKENKKELGDSFNQDKYFKGMRNMMLTDSLLRRGELAAERRESMNFMKSMYPLLEQAGRNQLERAIEGDQRSPTKISQQILRAKQGEAALMNAVANQTSAAAQVGGLGTGRRYGR